MSNDNGNGNGRGAPGETSTLEQALWEIALREEVKHRLEEFFTEMRETAHEVGIEFEVTLELDLRIDTSRAVRLFRSDAELIACAFPPDRIGGPNDCE